MVKGGKCTQSGVGGLASERRGITTRLPQEAEKLYPAIANKATCAELIIHHRFIIHQTVVPVLLIRVGREHALLKPPPARML